MNPGITRSAPREAAALRRTQWGSAETPTESPSEASSLSDCDWLKLKSHRGKLIDYLDTARAAARADINIIDHIFQR